MDDRTPMSHAGRYWFTLTPAEKQARVSWYQTYYPERFGSVTVRAVDAATPDGLERRALRKVQDIVARRTAPPTPPKPQDPVPQPPVAAEEEPDFADPFAD